MRWRREAVTPLKWLLRNRSPKILAPGPIVAYFAAHETYAGQNQAGAAARRHYRRVGRRLWRAAAGTAARLQRRDASNRVARRADDAVLRDQPQACRCRGVGHRRAFE